MIGEVADGIKVHPLHTLDYLDTVVRPNLEAGRAAGRAVGDLEVVVPVVTAVADDEESLHQQREKLRQRLAFYGSPGYGVVFDASGWPGTAERLNELLRAGELPQMARTITDEMLDAMTVSATWSDLPKALAAKYRGRATRIVCYSTLEQWADDESSVERWQDVIREFKQVAR